MSYTSNNRGAVDIRLPLDTAVLSITVDDTQTTGYAVTFLDNPGGYSLEDLGFQLRRAYSAYLDRLNQPGYEPSLLFAFAQEVERQIEGAQIVSIPAAPDLPENTIF